MTKFSFYTAWQIGTNEPYPFDIDLNLAHLKSRMKSEGLPLDQFEFILMDAEYIPQTLTTN